MGKKKTIYYARTYRRLKLNLKENIIFTCILMIPALIFMILNIDEITSFITVMTEQVLSKILPDGIINVASMDYSILNTVYFIELPTTYPGKLMIIINLVICIVAYLVIRRMRVTGRPLAIYFLFMIFIHTVNCVFFLFAGDKFPYTTSEYSYLYLVQQVGIWLTFIVLGSLVVGFMGERGYVTKILTFISIMAYSLVFGAIRYILYMAILYKFSVLYMAILFFVIGPMFDFSYFVAIYSAFVNKTIKDYDYGKKKGEWEWS